MRMTTKCTVKSHQGKEGNSTLAVFDEVFVGPGKYLVGEHLQEHPLYRLYGPMFCALVQCPRLNYEQMKLRRGEARAHSQERSSQLSIQLVGDNQNHS